MNRAPPAEAPPAYARAVSRVYRRDLRPIVGILCVISGIWLAIIGASSFRYVGQNGETGTMRLFDIIAGALAFGLVGTQVLGVAAVVLQKLPLVKTYSVVSFFASCLAIATEVVEIVEHFVAKQDLINQCISNNQSVSNPGTLTNDGFVSQDIRDDCTDSWNRGTAYVIGWLIIALIWAAITTAIAVAYYHQLSDPSRNRMQAPSAAYAGNAYHMNPYGPGQDPPFVPPYPEGDALPGYDGPGASDGKFRSAGDEKAGHHGDEEQGYASGGGDIASRHHDGLSDVTLHAEDTGREREGRV